MKKIILLLVIFSNFSIFAFDRDQCTIGLVRYLTFYDFKGFIPLIVGKIAKDALRSCDVPHGDQFTPESTKCAIEMMQQLGQLGGNHSLCSEIDSDLEQECFDHIYTLYPEKKIRPVSYLKRCIGIASPSQLECIKKKSSGVKFYFFDEEDMEKCTRECNPN